MIDVRNVNKSKEILPEKVAGSHTPYGVWSYGMYNYNKRLYYLARANSDNRYWCFVEISGNHSGFSNHDSCEKAINNMLNYTLNIVVPETKEELINLMKEYLS